MTALATIPIPGTDLVPDGWWQSTVVPWADEQLDPDEISTAAAQLAGMIAAYGTLGADTLELTKARRYLEVRWGELLGEARPGPPVESSAATEDSPLSKDQRHEFRELASHKLAVLEVLRLATEADQITRAAIRRATKPPKPTAQGTIDFLRSQADDPDGATHSFRESLGEARDRLKAQSAVEWTSQQQRKAARALDLVDVARSKVLTARDQPLSAHAIAELVRASAIAARQAAAALEDLAFTFERG